MPAWKKGQTGNPGGRKKEPAALRRMKHYTRHDIDMTLLTYIGLTRPQLETKLSDERNPPTLLELMVASVITRAIEQGCNVRLNFMLDRIIGKVKEAQPAIPLPETHIEQEAEQVAEATDAPKKVIYEVLMNDTGKFKHIRPQLKAANE